MADLHTDLQALAARLDGPLHDLKTCTTVYDQMRALVTIAQLVQGVRGITPGTLLQLQHHDKHGTDEEFDAYVNAIISAREGGPQ